MVKNKLFEPILNIVIETMPRDNLLNSACLEFFEFIKRVCCADLFCFPRGKEGRLWGKMEYMRVVLTGFGSC